VHAVTHERKLCDASGNEDDRAPSARLGALSNTQQRFAHGNSAPGTWHAACDGTGQMHASAPLPDTPPAYIAPATPTAQSTPDSTAATPHRLSFAVGLGVGGGTYGVAGDWFVQGDLWVMGPVGFGAEYERGGSTSFVSMGPNSNDAFSAEPARLSLRFPLAKGTRTTA
jgi:hypothetical protein